MHSWQRVRRWIKKQFTAQALILIYHRVVDLPSDPHLLAVRPDHFAEQLEVIRKLGFPLSLMQLVDALQAGAIPDRTIVITFDDGYADNLDQAKPLLESYEIPATVFTMAGQLGSQREFWWDELDRILLQPGSLPEKLELNLNGKVYEWLLGEADNYTSESYQRNQNWHIERKDDPSPRHQLFRNLYEVLQPLPDRTQQKILDELCIWARIGRTGRPSHRTLSLEELALLDKGGLVEIGTHTFTHPSLASLPVAEQRHEIQSGREYLEKILKHPVKSFAYPYGSSTPETITMLRDLDFLCACSSDPDTVGRGANLFYLPRVVVRDWDRQTFSRWLRWWIGG